MIAKVFTGNRLASLLDYVYREDKSPEVMDSTCLGISREDALESIGHQIRNSESAVREPVVHVTVSIEKHRELEWTQWQKIAREVTGELGLDCHAYVAVRHHDTDHEHIHIVSSRISEAGRAASLSHSYVRVQQVMRRLERELGLQQLPTREERQHAPEPDLGRAAINFERRTGQVSQKRLIQQAIAQASHHRAPGVWREALLEHRVEIRCRVHPDSGRIEGISYSREGVSIAGYRLGAGASWGALSRQFGPMTSQMRSVMRTPAAIFAGEVSRYKVRAHLTHLKHRTAPLSKPSPHVEVAAVSQEGSHGSALTPLDGVSSHGGDETRDTLPTPCPPGLRDEVELSPTDLGPSGELPGHRPPLSQGPDVHEASHDTSPPQPASSPPAPLPGEVVKAPGVRHDAPLARETLKTSEEPTKPASRVSLEQASQASTPRNQAPESSKAHARQRAPLPEQPPRQQEGALRGQVAAHRPLAYTRPLPCAMARARVVSVRGEGKELRLRLEVPGEPRQTLYASQIKQMVRVEQDKGASPMRLPELRPGKDTVSWDPRTATLRVQEVRTQDKQVEAPRIQAASRAPAVQQAPKPAAPGAQPPPHAPPSLQKESAPPVTPRKAMEVFHEKVKPDASPLIRIKDPQGQIISRAQCEAALKSQGVKIHTPQTPQPSHGHMLARDVQLREGRFHLVHYPDKKTYELVPYRREHEPLRDTKIVVHRDASGRPGHITPRVTPERQPAMKAQAQDTSKAREASRLPNIKDICASMHQKLGYSVTPIQQGDTIKGVVLPQQVMTTQGRQQIIQETHEKGVNFYLVPASPELSALKGREVEIHQRPDRALEIKEKVPQIEKSPSRDR